MKRIRMMLTSALSLFLITAILSAPQVQAQDHHETGVEDPDIVVHVKGMACSMCARSMHSAVSKVEGVEGVEVLLKEQKVLVTLKEGEQVTEEALEEAVTGAGYDFLEAIFVEPENDDA